MPRGRPRLPGTEAERAELRRAKVRQNVQAFRARQKINKKVVIDSTPDGSSNSATPSKGSRSSSQDSSPPVDEKFVATKQDCADEASDESPTTTALIQPRHLNRPPSRDTFLSIKIPLAPDTSPEYRKAFLAAFHDRYHPDISSSPQPQNATALQLIANVPCSSWVEAACDQFGDDASAALSEATLAAALAVIGAELSQQEISIESLRIYLVAMKKIRTDLFEMLIDPDGRRAGLRTLFLASFACATTELLCNNNLVNVLEHVKGMGSLIQRRGVEAMRDPDMRILLYEFRVIDSVFALLARKSSFLCRPEWIDTPWRMDPEHQAIPVQTLFDIAYLIPPLLEEYDRVFERSNSREERLGLLAVIQAIVDQLDHWVLAQVSLIEMDPVVIGTQRRTEAADDYPWAKTYAYPFRLLTWSMVAALETWLPYKIMLLDMFISIQVENGKEGDEEPEAARDRILEIAAARREIIRLAREIRRCTPYFLEKNMKLNGWLMTLYPFQTAHFEFLKARQRYEEQEDVPKEELHRLDEDIEWCEELTHHYIQRGFNIQMLSLSSELEK